MLSGACGTERMTLKKDDFSSGRITLEQQDLQTAHRLIDQLTELIAGNGRKRTPEAAKRRYDLACQLGAARRSRAALLPNELFDEPAWDIMLHLYCAAGRDEVTTTNALGRSVSAPSSTIERWVEYLVERNLVEYKDGLSDNKDSEVRLSENGFSRLDAYFRMLLEHDFRV